MRTRLVNNFVTLLVLVVINVTVNVIPGITAPPNSAQAASISTLRLTAQNFHIYTSGNLRFVFAVEDTALLDALLLNPNALFRVSLGSRVVTGAEEVRGIIAAPTSFRAIDTVEFSVRDVRRRADDQFEVIALSTDTETGTKRLEFQGVGIYPVRIEAIVNNAVHAELLAFVNRFNSSTRLDPMPVTVVVSLESPITLQQNGSHVIDDATQANIERIVELMELDGQLLSMQISPQTIDGLSRSSNPVDQTLFARLIAALGSTTLVDAPYVAFDPSDAHRSKRDEDFTELLERGRNTWRRLSANSPIASGVWIARTPLDQNGLDLLVASGFRSILMLPSSSEALGVFDNTARPYRLTSGVSTVTLHVADPSYVAQLSDPDNNSFLGASHLAAQLLAQRNKIENDGGTPSLRHVMLISGDGSMVNPALLHETLLILKRVPQQIALQTLVDLPDPRQDAFKPTLRPGRSTSIADRMRDIDALRVDLNKVKSSLNEASALWQTWEERLIVASSDTLNESQRAEFLAGTRAELRVLRTAVTLQEGTTFTLGSRKSQLRLDLQNASTEDMTVQVHFASAKLRFTQQAPIIRVHANSSSELVVDVVALSNGLFPVEVRIFTADGLSQLGRRVEVSARVNALAGLGQVITGVGILLLVTWWVMHLRHKYRKRIGRNHPVLCSKP